MSVSHEMKAYLEAQGIAGLVTTDFEPAAKIGRLTIITTYGGLEPSRNHSGADARSDHERFQVESRHSNPRTAEMMAKWAQNRIARISNRFLGDEPDQVWYQDVRPLQPPFFLRRDAQGRTVWVANYEADHAAPVIADGPEEDEEEVAS